MDAITPVASVDMGPSRYARFAQIAAAERVAEVTAMQEPRPPEAVSVLRELHVARYALMSSGVGAIDGVSAAVAAYNRATRLLSDVTESGAVLPRLR